MPRPPPHTHVPLPQDPKGPMSEAGISLSAVKSISVSGQQHGTVYWARGAGERLTEMAGRDQPQQGAGSTTVAASQEEQEKGVGVRDISVAEALSSCFAVEDSPIWADGSTEQYAAELESVMGGAAKLAELTGSRAHLRQGAPQIMKVL